MRNAKRGFGLIEMILTLVVILILGSFYSHYAQDAGSGTSNAQEAIDRANAVAEQANSRVRDMNQALDLGSTATSSATPSGTANANRALSIAEQAENR